LPPKSTLEHRPARLARIALVAALLAVLPVDSVASAQTINGTLRDLTTDQPIRLGLVMMFTEEGDSVGLAVTDEGGRFSITSPDPGSFVLLASALGYRETPAGVFELGEGGALTVEYRLPLEPIPLEQLVVPLDRPVYDHHLVRNGFVRRFQRGLGVFVTPHDIEEALVTSTEQLLSGLPGINVQPVRVRRGETLIPRADMGEAVTIRAPGGGWCVPTVYVDGMRVHYGAETGVTLSTLASLDAVDAIEVYRRAAEVPPEYSQGAGCGVMVVWTKLGLPPGQGFSRTASGSSAGSSPGALPSVSQRGAPPVSGEHVRMQLDADVAESLGLTSPWEGTFRGVLDGQFLADDPATGRPVALPLNGLDVLQVERLRGRGHAAYRGAVAGIGVGALTWVALRILCRSGCDGGVDSPWFPATLAGLFAGGLVGLQGPGRHWVETPVPMPEISGAGVAAFRRRPPHR
jgi:hypothetical protein